MNESNVQVSFLINALYLFGNHRILVAGEHDANLADSLKRIGHQVDDVESNQPQSAPSNRYDRAVSFKKTFGYGPEAEELAGLRAMHKSLTPGGLLTFRIFDRDQVLSLAHGNSDPEQELMGPWDFDPATGKLSGRAKVTEQENQFGLGKKISVRTYHFQEIVELLNSTGFALERAYTDWNGRTPNSLGASTGRLIVVATRIKRAGNRRTPKLNQRSKLYSEV